MIDINMRLREKLPHVNYITADVHTHLTLSNSKKNIIILI